MTMEVVQILCLSSCFRSLLSSGCQINEVIVILPYNAQALGAVLVCRAASPIITEIDFIITKALTEKVWVTKREQGEK